MFKFVSQKWWIFFKSLILFFYQVVLVALIFQASAALTTFGRSNHQAYNKAASYSSGGSDAQAVVKSLDSDVRSDGFQYNYETSNNIRSQSAGDAYGNAHGNFGWISPEGEHIDIVYVADENGYQPTGSAIPTPPPTPEYVYKALAYIAAHPPKETTYTTGKRHF